MLAVLLLTTACTGLRNIGKSEIDMVADLHIKKIDDLLGQLTVSLYENNPEELNKTRNTSVEIRLSQIINHPLDISYAEIEYHKGIEAILLAIDKNYQGDRVFALMVGISGMLRRAYDGRRELFLTDTLDAQKLYNSSVNLNKIRGLLNDHAFLNLGDGQKKDSFAGVMPRLASIQEMMAEIFANRNHNHINKIVRGTAALFIPI